MTPVLRVVWEAWADRSLPLPGFQTVGAAGADLCANLMPEDRVSGFILDPMRRAVIPPGIRVEIPKGYEAQIRLRSCLRPGSGFVEPSTATVAVIIVARNSD